MVIERAQVTRNEWTPFSEVTGQGPLCKRELMISANDKPVGYLMINPIATVRAFGRVDTSYYFDGTNGRELCCGETYELLEKPQGLFDLNAWGENCNIYLQFLGDKQVDLLEKEGTETWRNSRTGRHNWDVVVNDSGLSLARVKILFGEITDKDIESILKQN